MPSRRALILAAACAGLALAVALFVGVMLRPAGATGGAGVSGAVTSSGRADIGGPFRMVDQDGRPADERLLKGRWTAVFFGYTYCPDYCPTTLASLGQVQRRLAADGKALNVVLVSVDPARDTPAQLKAYLGSEGFPSGTVGLTGTPAQVAAMARAYRIYYARRGDGPDYLMDHSTAVYLMDPDGRFSQALAYQLGPDRMAEIVERTMARH